MNKWIIFVFLLLSFFPRDSYCMVLQQRFVDACVKDDLDQAKSLFQTDRTDTRTEFLNIAAMAGNIRIAEFLLESGVSIHEPTLLSNTPLHIACREGRAKMVKFLIERRAFLEIKNMFGQVPLHMAIREDNDSQEEIVLALLKSGARIDVADISEWTPVHYAAYIPNDQKSLKILMLLLKKFKTIPDEWLPDRKQINIKEMTLEEHCIDTVILQNCPSEVLNRLPILGLRKKIHQRKKLLFIKYCLNMKEAVTDSVRDLAVSQEKGSINLMTASYIDRVLHVASYQEFLKI